MSHILNNIYLIYFINNQSEFEKVIKMNNLDIVIFIFISMIEGQIIIFMIKEEYSLFLKLFIINVIFYLKSLKLINLLL
jgi:hypothetical protein